MAWSAWVGRHPTTPDADPVFHFTSGKLVVQSMVLKCQRQSLSELDHEQPKTLSGGVPHAWHDSSCQRIYPVCIGSVSF